MKWRANLHKNFDLKGRRHPTIVGRTIESTGGTCSVKGRAKATANESFCRESSETSRSGVKRSEARATRLKETDSNGLAKGGVGTTSMASRE